MSPTLIESVLSTLVGGKLSIGVIVVAVMLIGLQAYRIFIHNKRRDFELVTKALQDHAEDRERLLNEARCAEDRCKQRESDLRQQLLNKEIALRSLSAQSTRDKERLSHEIEDLKRQLTSAKEDARLWHGKYLKLLNGEDQ